MWKVGSTPREDGLRIDFRSKIQGKCKLLYNYYILYPCPPFMGRGYPCSLLYWYTLNIEDGHGYDII